MKTLFKHIAFFALFISGDAFAQDVTTVRANNSDISDNLDLKAVASIFGESQDLEDFERRLNDPEMQISNLDLNGDNRVDYLRVIDASENNVHLIIIQSVIGADTFQDIATIEVERDRSNNVQVQVVGDVYMYGSNYIYEPAYIYTPSIFNIFWVSSYRPYYSPWYWGYYPTYYSYWAPYPVYRYRTHIHTHINPRNTYAYTNTRRSTRAVNLYNSRRQNAYERQHPNTSFSSRNNNAANRYALEQTRTTTKSSRGVNTTQSRSAFTNSSRTNNVKSSNINTVKRSAVSSEGTQVRSAQSVRTADSPARSSNNAVRNNSSRMQTSSQPARVERSAAPVQTRNVQRSAAPAPARNIERSAPARSSNNMSTPARSMRSTPAPAPSRQSAPASRGSSTGNSRRG